MLKPHACLLAWMRLVLENPFLILRIFKKNVPYRLLFPGPLRVPFQSGLRPQNLHAYLECSGQWMGGAGYPQATLWGMSACGCATLGVFGMENVIFL